MPNWCNTDYKIEGDSQALERIKDAIDSASSVWQDEIVENLRVELSIDYGLRGYLTSGPDIEDGVLHVTFDEAWGRSDFAEVLKEKFPSLRIYWMAEEPGSQIFETNDAEGKYYTDRFFVDAYIGEDYFAEYFEDAQDAWKYIASISECESEEDVESFNENRRLADSEEYIYIHEFEVIED